MSPDYDASKEIDRLENRFNREMDRRFNEVNDRLADLKKQLELLDAKWDTGRNKEDDRLYERHTWSIRQIIIVALTFVMGGGALGIIQAIMQVLSHGGK